MSKRDNLEALFLKHGFDDFKWIDPKTIVVRQWVRLKCVFGCHEYGRIACCPPNTPTVEQCERFFSEYIEAVVFHFEKNLEKPEERHAWSRTVNKRLLKLEREVFLANNPKTFLLFMDSCSLCEECAGARVECKNKRLARPSPESMAVDVYSTVKQIGYPIEVLQDYSKTMNRYAIILIE